MRVIHLIPYMHPSAGGPPVVVDRWTAALVQNGHRAEVITTDGYAKGDQHWIQRYAQHYPIHVGRMRGPAGFGFSRGMRSKLLDLLPQTDLVHVHNLWGYANQLAAKHCPRYGVPYVVSTHGMLDPHSMARKSMKKRVYGRLREWPALRGAAGLVYTHEEEKRLALETLCPLPQGHVVSLGADPPDASREDLAAEFWQRNPRQDDRPLVLFLGRLHEKKGLELLLPALHLIPENERPRLLLVGPGDAGYVQHLNVLVQRLALARDVAFAGPLSGRDKYAALAAADIFVLPSYQENFAITVVEALHSGTPVIISDRVNLCDDLLRNDAAVRCELSPESIAGEMKGLLANDTRRQTLAKNGRRVAADHYTWQRSLDSLLDTYRTVLNGSERLP